VRPLQTESLNSSTATTQFFTQCHFIWYHSIYKREKVKLLLVVVELVKEQKLYAEIYPRNVEPYQQMFKLFIQIAIIQEMVHDGENNVKFARKKIYYFE
jgi:hypothetical protein